MADDRVGITIRISKDEHRALKDGAAALDRSLNWIIRRAITDYLDRQRADASGQVAD